MVATVLLPFSTTVTGNCINRAITPRRTGHIRWPMSGTLAWRNLAWRNRRNSTACSNGRMAWLGVVGTVTADDIDLFFAWNRRCCINRARSIDVYAQQSRSQIPIKSDSRVTA
ncbi:MAG: hypothetical protein E5299_00962 [Burkholderia gladioli]|nr:MAG: hypothetical protein E5299_00962 [Burkholderia gladioli]